MKPPRRTIRTATTDPDKSVLNPSRHRPSWRIKLGDLSSRMAYEKPSSSDKWMPGKREFGNRVENLQASSLHVVNVDSFGIHKRCCARLPS